MNTSVRLYLSYNHLDWILLPLNLIIVQQKIHNSHGRRHDFICSHQSVM